MIPGMRRRALLKAGAGLLLAPSVLRAQDPAATWPSKTVRLIIPFTPGGSTDFQGRLLTEWLSRHFGQQFFIDYKPGAGSNLGVAEVARSAPDGYTLGWITVASHAINPTLYAKMPFDHIRDFAPVSMTGVFPNLLVVNNQLPVKTVADLVALAKKEPGKLTFASSGQGTSLHLSGELFKMMTGIQMQHVPYRGAGPAYPDLMTGKTQVFFDNLPGSVELVKSGQLKALGVTQAKRSFVFPDLPSIGESVPGYDVSLYYGVSGPKGIPPAIVETLSNALQIAQRDPKMLRRIAEFGGTPLSLPPAEFGKLVADETEKWAKVVNTVGLSID